jgi:hypothetical protein
VERGITIFVEKNLEGTPPDPEELRRLSKIIMTRYPQRHSRLTRLKEAIRSRGRRLAARRLREEWSAEGESGVGPVTRALLTWTVLRAAPGREAILRAAMGLEPSPPASTEVTEDVAPLAKSLVKISLASKPRAQAVEPPR